MGKFLNKLYDYYFNTPKQFEVTLKVQEPNNPPIYRKLLLVARNRMDAQVEAERRVRETLSIVPIQCKSNGKVNKFGRVIKK